MPEVVHISFPSSDELNDTSKSSQSNISETQKRDFSFWMVIFAVNISVFVALLDTTIISNALPTIVHTLNGGSDFIWVGSAYNLAAASVMPLTGALAQIFGRKPIILVMLLFFALGSTLCGAAHNMPMLISGRAIQGIGGAGLLSSSAIIISDVVPLAERGTFNGLLQLAWCVASGIGPVVGGKLAQDGQWRWIFYLNLPICFLAIILVTFFLNLKVPERSRRENIEILDIVGNLLLITGSCSFGIGLIWGGVTFPWRSAHVLVPISVGSVALVSAIIYEYKWSPRPAIPIRLMNNRTVLSGYMQILICPLSVFSIVYYLPIYFQACKGSSPTRSGVEVFGIAFSVAPIALISGYTVTKTKRYRGQLWVGWVLMIVGLALLGTVHADTSLTRVIGFEIVTGAGFGIVLSATYFPVLAPLPITSIAQALSFFAFLRQFTQVWGIVVGGVILQNELDKFLPPAFLANTSSAQAISAIPVLEANLSSGELALVRSAFAQSLAKLWQVMAGIMGAGLLVSFLMGHYTLHLAVDKNYDVAHKAEATYAKIKFSDVDSESRERVEKAPGL